jgi:glycine dehydrogenase subunit 2
MAALPGFTNVHPLAPAYSTQGCQEVLSTIKKYLCEVSGMDDMTFQPAAGAHGEFTGVLLIKQYHDARGDKKRTKIIVPDSAHGTNPATAAMCGFDVVNIASAPDGCVDLEALKAVLGDDTAGLMLTNPNTVGIFDENILEITRLVHEAGGLCYYDGANLNAVMGVVRPGDMGFDCIHMNLHKTFATPHGGGGPGAGAVGCKKFLAEFLPKSAIMEGGKHVQVRSFTGNFLVVVRALTYIMTLGKEGIREAAENAVLNANYLQAKIKGTFEPAFDRVCMHELCWIWASLRRRPGCPPWMWPSPLLTTGCTRRQCTSPSSSTRPLCWSPPRRRARRPWTGLPTCSVSSTSWATRTPSSCTTRLTTLRSAVPTRFGLPAIRCCGTSLPDRSDWM